MQLPIADEAPHRTRVAWLSAAVAASVIAFALMRPAHARHHHHHHMPFIGQCGEHHHVHALPPQSASVHSYYVYY